MQSGRPYPDAAALCDSVAMHGALYLPDWMPDAERAARRLPAAAAAIQAISALYLGARYGRAASGEQIVELRRRVRALHLA